MIHDNRFIPIITLIGDPLENFYRLGKQDKNNCRPVLDEIKCLVQTPWKNIDKGISEAGVFLLKNSFPQNSPLKKHIEAYAEGLEIPFKEVALGSFIPEIISSLHRWAPYFTPKNLGRTSYFMIDEKNNSPIHLQLINFSLLDNFDTHERFVVTQFPGETKITSHGSLGLPYSSFSFMNSCGVTLATHLLQNNIFNSKGSPLFEIIHDLMAYTKTPQDAIRILKKRQSINSWSLYMLFKTGEVLLIELLGEVITTKILKLKEKQILCFSNLHANHHQQRKSTSHDDFLDYRKMIEASDYFKIKKLLKGEKLTEESLLKMITSPLKKTQKEFINWKADSASPTMMAALTLNPKEESSLYIPGPAPKYYNGEFVQLAFKKKKETYKHILDKGEYPGPEWKEGMKRLILGMQAYQKKELHTTYHQMQMACQFLEGFLEHKLARLYLAFYRALNEEEKENRQDILKDLYDLKDDLPVFLKDHCLLFIWRLERMIGKKSKIKITDIENSILQKTMKMENKIPKFLHFKLTAPLTHPRPDILTVEYAYNMNSA